MNDIPTDTTTLQSFESVLNVREIGSFLIELLDCIAINSLIELNLVALDNVSKAFTKQYRMKKYKDEIDDRQIRTVHNIFNKNKNKLRCRTLNITVPHKMELVFDSLLQQVLDDMRFYGSVSLRETISNKCIDQDVTAVCQSALDPQNYPLNQKFAFDDELCLKMILLTVAMENIDSIFAIHDAVEYQIKKSNWNYNTINEVWCKRFIQQDLIDQFTSRNEIAPASLRKLKHTFDVVFIGDEAHQEQDIRVMSAYCIKCNDIKNYNNVFEGAFSSDNMIQCLENKKFGELMLNEYAADDIDDNFKMNPNILNIISDKMLCPVYLKDIITDWYCFDVKCMQRGSCDYVNDTFFNNFYGVLSTKLVEQDEQQSVYEIQFVEAVVSYFYNYCS
eukprot:382066_1